MRRLSTIFTICITCFSSYGQDVFSEPDPARFWINNYLEAIRKDFFGPTIHARNMYHISAVLYDTYWVYNPDVGEPLFLNKEINGVDFSIGEFEPVGNRDSCLLVSLNYAAFHLLKLRFAEYSSKVRNMDDFIFALEDLGLNPGYGNSDYSAGSPAALGVYIAEKMYEFGLEEGAGDLDGYESDFQPLNRRMKPNVPGNPNLTHCNHWQPLAVREYIEEKGWDSTIPDWFILAIPSEDNFLTPHWGNLRPFAMTDRHKTTFSNKAGDFNVYNDPGAPPQILKTDNFEQWEEYKWNFLLLASWSSQLDPADEVKINISPGAIGPTSGLLPDSFEDYQDFYDLENGGVKTKPQKKNPYTGKPYKDNWVKRGDYARCIAEFWVDAIGTYSPPGHWIKMLHEISDSPGFERKWKGKGPELSKLEWSIKSQLALTGGLHDAGMSAWSIKAYYDYIRPISAIRWMADNGQSSDSTLDNYHRFGLPLIDGFIELVDKKDPLVGENREHLNKIKIRSWKGPDYINDPEKDKAGVDWILAENWWPYQRYSFVTPPFAGYVSGHSCFSIASAEILEFITGSAYFPGGIKEVTLETDFLDFEDGPSEPITLQWATYREAADETCLSRVWGGIHPPVDDVEGRKVGEEVAETVEDFVDQLFKNK